MTQVFHDIADIKARLSDDDLVAILSRFGVDARVGKNFRLRDDDANPSCSLKNGYIKDFNGSFSGDILDYLEQFQSMEFAEAKSFLCEYMNLEEKEPAPREPIEEDYTEALNTAHRHYKEEYEITSEDMDSKTEELFNKKLIRANSNYGYIFFKYFGYSSYWNSLTVSLFDEVGDVKCISTRQAGAIKWKAQKGSSKTFTPHRFTCKDKNIFVAFGTAEVILFELLEIPYLCLQSDSMAYNLKNNTHFNKLQGHLKDKRLICLLDNDESCFKAYKCIYELLNDTCEVVGVDMKQLANKELPKGYDFRDYCNDQAKELKANEEIREKIIRNIFNEISRRNTSRN